MPRKPTAREVLRIRGFQLAVFFIITIAVCFVIAFLVVRQQIDANTAAVRAATAKQAVLTCRALQGLDNAKNGITFSAPTKTGSAERYIIRLVQNLHNVYVSTGCQKLLG